MYAVLLLYACYLALVLAVDSSKAPSASVSPIDQPSTPNSDRDVGALHGHSQVYWDEDEIAGRIRYMYKERYPDPKVMAGKVFFKGPFTPPLSTQGSPLHDRLHGYTPETIKAISDARRSSAASSQPVLDTASSSSRQDASRAASLRKGKGVVTDDNTSHQMTTGPVRLDKHAGMKSVWSQIHDDGRILDDAQPAPVRTMNKELSFSQGIPFASDSVPATPPTKAHDGATPDLGPAKAKLAAYVEAKKQSKMWKKPLKKIWRWSKPPSSPAGTDSESMQGHHSDSTEMFTPRAHFSPDEPASPLGGGEKVQTILPYRAWSEQKALRGVKIPASSGINKLTDHRSAHWEHWKASLNTYRKQTYWDRYLERMFWVARNAQQDTTEHRALVNGAPTGTTSYSKLKFGPIDPKDPPPPHPGRRETLLEERMEVFQRLFYRIPPALTYHSPEVYRQNARGYYIYAADPKIQETVHPIHYLQQILVNPRATGILENYNAKDQQALEDHWVYNRQLDHTISTQERAVRRVGEDMAIRNMFWPSAWQRDPAFHIKDPLTAPLEDWSVFEPYIDAIKLRPS